MKFLRYLNLDQKNTIKALVMLFLGYFILIFSHGFQHTIILYLRFFLTLTYVILIPGYFFSVIALDRDRLGKVTKIGILYLSLLWGSIIIIFEA
ncbi:MAG: hypothetical protein ACFFCW_04695, partial [Candidatus Hodarchaeota archaeon]